MFIANNGEAVMFYTIKNCYKDGEYTKSTLLNHSIDLKSYYNFYSVLFCVGFIGIISRITWKCLAVFIWAMTTDSPPEQLEFSIVVLILGTIFLILTAYLPFVLIKFIIEDLYPLFKTYKFNKNIPIIRMKYKNIKSLSTNLKDFHIMYYHYNYKGIDRYGFDYNGDDICGSFFSYFVLMCAYFTYKMKKKVVTLVSKIGFLAFLNKQDEVNFKKEVNNNTEQVINKILRDVDSLKKQSNKEINQAREKLNCVDTIDF